MAEEDKLAEDNFRDLQNKLRDRQETQFRRKLFGGINQEDVVKYVQTVSERLHEEEERFQERIKELLSSNKTLRGELGKTKRRLEEEEENATRMQNLIESLEAEKAHLEGELDKARCELKNYVNKYKAQENSLRELNQRYGAEVGNLRKENWELTQARDEMGKRISEFEQETESLRKYALEAESAKLANEGRIEGLEQEKGLLEKSNLSLKVQLEESQKELEDYRRDRVELEEIYRKMELLEEKAKGRDLLEEELDRQYIRATKAEKEAAKLGEWVIELKDRIRKDRNFFDSRLKELEEIHYESSRRYVVDILREASQITESLLASARQNAECIMDGATQKIHEVTDCYQTLQSNVVSFRDDLQDVHLKTGAEIEALYDTLEHFNKVSVENCKNQLEKKSKVIQLSK